MEAGIDSVEEFEKVDALEERPRIAENPDGDAVNLRESSSKTFSTTMSGSSVVCVLLVNTSANWKGSLANWSLVVRALFERLLEMGVLR